MEDENAKEENQPSTSKKETQRTASGNDLYSDRRDDIASSETSMSNTFSARSRIELANDRPELPKPTLGKREPKTPERKKQVRRNIGRVDKRKRSFMRRQLKKMPKRKFRARELKSARNLSMSTIFTRLSSRSGSRSPGCVHCGHRCCRRRYDREQRRLAYEMKYQARRYAQRRRQRRKVMRIRTLKRNPGLKKFPRLKKFPGLKKMSRFKKLPGPKKLLRQKRMTRPKYTVFVESKKTQAGSPTLMLSPLFLYTNDTPEPPAPEPEALEVPQSHIEVSPQMIHEALQNLMRWKQYVPTGLIADYIKRSYPVNKDVEALMKELREKLRVAVIVGLVVQTCTDSWCLTCELQNRSLTANHVTLFWQAYADTLSPVYKKPLAPQQEKETVEKPTNTGQGKRKYDDSDVI